MNSQNTDRDLLIAALNKNQVTYSQVSKIAEEIINGVLKLKTLPMEKEFVFEYMNKKVYIDLNALKIEGLKYLNNILIDDILTSYELNEVYKILDQLKNELLNKADINHTHTSFNKNVTLSNANLMFNQSNAAKDQAITFTNNSDLARIRFYNYDGTKEHGALEIATADDQSEPIYLRQYKYKSGPWNQIGREACLLDASGNTQFPGTVTASNLTSTNETRLAQCENLITTKADESMLTALAARVAIVETDKADVNHNHDTAYAALNHNHDTAYAALNHNHDNTYVKTSDVVTTDTNINESLTFISSSSTNYTTTISGTTATITVDPTYYASLSKIALNVYILYFEQRETYYYEYDITNGRVLYDEPSLNHFDITVKHYNNVFTFTMHCDVDITDLNFFSVYMYADDDEKELRYKYSRETTHPYILNTNTTVGSVIADIAPKATLIDYYDVKKASADDFNKFVILKDLIDLIHPVGSIYTSMCNISPAQIFPNTTWTQIVDRFLYCSSSSNTTGGSATHTHTTGDCTLTVNQIPSHNHNYSQYAGYYITNGGAAPTGAWNGLKMVSEAPPDDFHTVYTGKRGGGQAHNHGNTGSANNLPPYITVYAWYRTS